MRWTNHFEHPGDNRYFVFTFPDEAESRAFQSRLEEVKIPFEYHMDPTEREPHLFAIHRKHFRAALRQNHLLKAKTRTKFIPTAGLRWLLLIGTGLVVCLAILGAFRNARAQGGWELAVEAGYLPAVEALGASSIFSIADSAGTPFLSAKWTPKGGSRLAVRLTHPLNETWSVTTGVTIQRIAADWELTFEEINGIGERVGNVTEGFLRLRGVRYRIPIIATTTVRLTNEQRVLAGAGFGADFSPTDIFASGYLQIDSAYHDFRVTESRTRIWNVPLLAEVGWEFRPDGALGWNPKQPTEHLFRGVYLGLQWSRELFQTRWGEAQWKYALQEQRTRLWMGPTAVGFVARFTLS